MYTLRVVRRNRDTGRIRCPCPAWAVDPSNLPWPFECAMARPRRHPLWNGTSTWHRVRYRSRTCVCVCVCMCPNQCRVFISMHPISPSFVVALRSSFFLGSRFDNVTKSLYEAIGRLVMSYDGNDYYCTGTLVQGSKSSKKDDRVIIATAAHCMYRKQDHAFYDNVMFLPGHGKNEHVDCTQNSQQCLYPVMAIVSDQYTDASLTASWEVDYGFYVVSQYENSVDGSSGSYSSNRYSQEDALVMTGSTTIIKPMSISFEPMIIGAEANLFGYPLDEDPNLMYTVGQVEETPIAGEEGYYVPCSGLSDGASGGPWTQSMSPDGDIVVSSINSWSWMDGSSGMGAPRLDTGGAYCLFRAANQGSIQQYYRGMVEERVSCPR